MPIDLPDLDDRTFAEMLDDARRMIPTYAPSWTDHNASDPGITFLELFASTAEMLIYRLNRVSVASRRAFLELLAPGRPLTPGKSVDEELSAAIREMRVEQRAVTPADYARLALSDPRVARAACLPRRNLEARDANRATLAAPGHDSVLIVPATGYRPAPVIQDLNARLASAALLGTTVHVVEPVMLKVAVKLTLHAFSDQVEAVVKQRALDALTAYFDARTGGPDGSGWPFGAPVYRSGVYALLERVPGVDFVDVETAGDLSVTDAAAGERRFPATAAFVGLRLNPNELVAFDVANSVITVPPPNAPV
jgi:Baseplate J-like protein